MTDLMVNTRPRAYTTLSTFDDGETFSTRARTITEADVVHFSALTRDWHPQHSDAEWASDSQFGERIAHGMLLLSYAIGQMDLDPERVKALRGLQRVTFKRPVPLGTTIHVRGSVLGSRAHHGGQRVVSIGFYILGSGDLLFARGEFEAVVRDRED